MAKRQDWDKFRRNRKVVNNGYAYLGEVEQGFQRQLANNVNNRDFNKKLYEKGIEFFNCASSGAVFIWKDYFRIAGRF